MHGLSGEAPVSVKECQDVYVVPTKIVRKELTEVMAILPAQYAEVIQRALTRIVQDEKFLQENTVAPSFGHRHE